MMNDTQEEEWLLHFLPPTLENGFVSLMCNVFSHNSQTSKR